MLSLGRGKRKAPVGSKVKHTFSFPLWHPVAEYPELVAQLRGPDIVLAVHRGPLFPQSVHVSRQFVPTHICDCNQGANSGGTLPILDIGLIVLRPKLFCKCV